MDADMMTRSPEADQMDMMMLTMLHMDQANSDKFPHEQYFTPYPCNPSHDMSSGVADTLTPTTFHSLPTPPVMSFNRHPPPMPDEDHALSLSPQAPAPSTVAAMREMIFRMAAMQPVHVDAEAVKAPRRKNVRISKDPQSVAARHRRERISERIRILQRMVPGGTKMDTASMLDEAIHYVKFLKRQVRSLEEQEASPQLPQPDQQQLSMFPAGFVEAEGSPTTRGDWHSGAPRWRLA